MDTGTDGYQSVSSQIVPGKPNMAWWVSMGVDDSVSLSSLKNKGSAFIWTSVEIKKGRAVWHKLTVLINAKELISFDSVILFSSMAGDLLETVSFRTFTSSPVFSYHYNLFIVISHILE